MFIDCMNFKMLWAALKKMGMPHLLIVLMGTLCDGQEATVRHNMERLNGFL